jgi:hypothetical protein
VEEGAGVEEVGEKEWERRPQHPVLALHRRLVKARLVELPPDRLQVAELLRDLQPRVPHRIIKVLQKENMKEKKNEQED